MHCDHSEQIKPVIRPSKFQSAPLCQLPDIDTVSGHTADPFFRKSARLPQNLLAGFAHRTSPIAQTEALHPLLPELLHQLQNAHIQGVSGREDKLLIFIAVDFPDLL